MVFGSTEKNSEIQSIPVNRGRLFYRPNWLSSLLLHMIFVVLIFDVLYLWKIKLI